MKKHLDLDFETFQVGESYPMKAIKEMIARNNCVVKDNYHGEEKPRKRAIHLNFTLEDVDLWFIQDGYNTYRCVMFEN